MKRLPRFADFLSRNSVKSGGQLPLVHSTQAYHIIDIAASDQIKAQPCDVFLNEKLNYFFVGRPAYKHKTDLSDPEYWQLPICFIFDYGAIDGVRRVFPFDTGAFQRRLYPDYINLMSREQFDCSEVSDSPSRIIGAYFGDVGSYYRLAAKDRKSFESEFALGVLDAEAKAVHRLSTERSATVFDDRRLAIEIQTSNDVLLTTNKPLAVVAPATYFDDQAILDKVEKDWGAQPLSYDVYPLNVSAYYSKIYEVVELLYRRMGYLP